MMWETATITYNHTGGNCVQPTHKYQFRFRLSLWFAHVLASIQSPLALIRKDLKRFKLVRVLYDRDSILLEILWESYWFDIEIVCYPLGFHAEQSCLMEFWIGSGQIMRNSTCILIMIHMFCHQQITDFADAIITICYCSLSILTFVYFDHPSIN